MSEVQSQSVASPPPPRPLPVTPEADESARGFMLRVAARNQCSTENIAQWLGLSRPAALLAGDTTLAGHLLDLPPEQLARMGFQEGDEGWVLGHKLHTEQLFNSKRVCCPDCLAEKPYHRRIWDLRQVDVCPRHSRQLIDRCPDCGMVIRWTSQWYLLFCNCGTRLDQPGISLSVDDCTGARAIYLHCGLSGIGEQARLPSDFGELPLASLLDVLFFLGRMDRVIARSNPDGLQAREMRTDRSILNAGTRIALGWPGSFNDLAERVRAARQGRSGVQRQYGYLHRFIMRSAGTPQGALLRTAYAQHLAGRDDVTERCWPVGLPHPGEAMTGLSPSEIQRALGLGGNSFSALRKTPLFTGIKPILSARNSTVQYARADIEALRTKLDRMVSPGVADRTLGLGKGRTDLLVAAGIVEVHHWNRHHRNSEQRSVDLADLESLFRRIRALAISTAPGRPVTFDTLLVMAQVRRLVSYIDVIQCLLSGQLRGYVADPGARVLSGVTFEKAGAETIMNRLASPARTGKMLLGVVKRKLGIPAKAVHQLVAEGLLPEPQRLCAYIFDIEAVQAFQDEFTYDVAVARQRGTAVGEVRQTLATVGMRPLTIITMRNGATAGVYRRADLPP